MRVCSFRIMLIVVAVIGYIDSINAGTKKELIVITDLYHPHQDPGDNFELINAFTLPNIDLKAVLIDCTNPFRKKVAKGLGKGLFEDSDGPREPGFISMHQLNYIFGKNIPFGIGPFEQMKSEDDKMNDLSDFYNQGLDLLKKTLEDSKKPVTIASFGSSRILAVAYNRFPELMKSRIEMIHVSAGTCSNDPDYLEWNVALDTIAFVTLLKSDLPITLYPCAAGSANFNKNSSAGSLANAFVVAKNNTFYRLNTLSFIEDMNPKLRQYCHYVFSRANDVDYLGYLDKRNDVNLTLFNKPHSVWETAIWMNVADQKLVKSKSGVIKIITSDSIDQEDIVFEEQLMKCDIKVKPSGIFEYTFNNKGRHLIYQRKDPALYQDWMNIAIPNNYKSLEIK